MTSKERCQNIEPWGRYSASGGIFSDNSSSQYLYSFGGDTTSNADGRGGVVRTNFRYDLVKHCWERLADAPTAIGYRATATQVASSSTQIYLIAGADASRAATNRVYEYSLVEDTWTLLNATGTEPDPRWKHAAIAIDTERILVTGGRGDNRLVHGDAWIFDTSNATWTPVLMNGLPRRYRHGLVWDTKRSIAWMHGGLDETLSRVDSAVLWQLNITSGETIQIEPAEITTASTAPPALASHAMEYVAELDVLILWGGSCGDDSELHVYDIDSRTWCRIAPAFRPDRRDAMLWSLQYPLFYVAQGDIICYNGQVLGIADVHVLNLTDLRSWAMLYEPFNTRGTGDEAYCDGSNAGNCQPQPLLTETNGYASTCSAELLGRFTPSIATATTFPSPMPSVVTMMPSSQSSSAGGMEWSSLWLLCIAQIVRYFGIG